MTYFTGRLASGAPAITINVEDQCFRITLKADGGTISLKGSVPTFKGMDSLAVTLNDGESFTDSSVVTSPIQGLTITPLTGTAEMIIGFGSGA